jgi:hypothetical protein
MESKIPKETLQALIIAAVGAVAGGCYVDSFYSYPDRRPVVIATAPSEPAPEYITRDTGCQTFGSGSTRPGNDPTVTLCDGQITYYKGRPVQTRAPDVTFEVTYKIVQPEPPRPAPQKYEPGKDDSGKKPTPKKPKKSKKGSCGSCRTGSPKVHTHSLAGTSDRLVHVYATSIFRGQDHDVLCELRGDPQSPSTLNGTCYRSRGGVPDGVYNGSAGTGFSCLHNDLVNDPATCFNFRHQSVNNQTYHNTKRRILYR